VAVTDGEGSHPGSPAWPPERLRQTRTDETNAALAQLGIDASRVRRLHIPDGGVTAAGPELERQLAAIIEPGDIVVTTWRFDGHPDHESTALACSTVARQRGARVLQAPVWGWHWSAPGDGAMPLHQARKLPVPTDALARKRAALGCFHSQIEGDASSGAAPILPAFAMERLLHPFELYFPDHA
jgi:LmbE family N-acetylglucosaminyl deacetylase